MKYMSVNRVAYNRLAPVYMRRMGQYRTTDIALLHPFISYLKNNFPDSSRVLEIGPGPGSNLALLTDRGFPAVGVDISDEMVNAAKVTAPRAHLIHGDFLTTQLPNNDFGGVISRCSLHLFSKPDAMIALRKVYSLLAPRGMFYVATTDSRYSVEGYFSKVEDDCAAIRYRKFWTRDELVKSLEWSGFRIFEELHLQEEVRKKRWLNLWAVKD